MKIPKTLRMHGTDFKVILMHDKNKQHGGSYNWEKREVRINDRYREAEPILLHEILESVLTEDLVRYYGNEGNTEYKFIFNHTEFTRIVLHLYQVLKDNKLI
jgi:hypothetical protein